MKKTGERNRFSTLFEKLSLRLIATNKMNIYGINAMNDTSISWWETLLTVSPNTLYTTHKRWWVVGRGGTLWWLCTVTNNTTFLLSSVMLLFDVSLVVKVEEERNDGSAIDEWCVLHPHGEVTANDDTAYSVYHTDEELSLQHNTSVHKRTLTIKLHSQQL